MSTTIMLLAGTIFALVLQGASCTPKPPEELDVWGTVDMTIANQAFRLWIADDNAEQQQGLMNVSAERMSAMEDGTERGMIFVFDRERILSFWMKNTIIPLDIAYVDTDGVIVSIYTMAPLDDRSNQYPSASPARFAIEVNAGMYERLGVVEGDKLDIPSSLLNP